MVEMRNGKERRLIKKRDVAVLLHTVAQKEGLSSTAEVTKTGG